MGARKQESIAVAKSKKIRPVSGRKSDPKIPTQTRRFSPDFRVCFYPLFNTNQTRTGYGPECKVEYNHYRHLLPKSYHPPMCLLCA